MPSNQGQKQTLPPQQQEKQPGRQGLMNPKPKTEDRPYRGSGRLEGKVALITGGDSGIGRAVAIDFAKEGANIVVVYLNSTRTPKKPENRSNRKAASAF